MAAQRLITEYCELQDQAVANRARINEILDAFKRHKLLSPVSIRLLRQHAFAAETSASAQQQQQMPRVGDRRVAGVDLAIRFQHMKGDPYETFVDNLDGLIDNSLRLFNRYEEMLAHGAGLLAMKPQLVFLVEWDLPRGGSGTSSGVDHSAVAIDRDRLAEWAVPVSKLTRDEKDLQRTLAAIRLFRIFCNLHQGKLPVATRQIYDSLLDAFRDYQLLSEKSIEILDKMSRRSLDLEKPVAFTAITFVHRFGEPYTTVLQQMDENIEMMGSPPEGAPNSGPVVPMGLYGDFDRGKPISVRPRDYSQVEIEWEKLVDRVYE